MWNTENKVLVEATRATAELVAEYLDEVNYAGGYVTFTDPMALAEDIWGYGNLNEDWQGVLINQNTLIYLCTHIN